jgi:D-3-phosphoglycerate dehydrogenase
LINTGRGALVDEQALYQALAEGWIAGAGLDVLEHEPPQENDPLLQLDNVIFGHHFGSYSEESWLDARRQVCEAIVQTLSGKWPAATVNREVVPRVTLV